MKLEGTKEFEAPREVVWSVINDPSTGARATVTGVGSTEPASSEGAGSAGAGSGNS